MAQWSVGIDTGGTFTDLAAVDHESGEVYVAKVPSTPGRPADALLEALERFSTARATPLADIALLAHGTTVATNAVLEGKGAKTALLVTAGYRAIYPARAGTRPRGRDLIDPGYRKAEPLIPLALTWEIPERIRHDGSVQTPLDREAVRRAARRLSAEGCRSVAICFLFSFLNDGHERAAAQIVREECPDVRVSISSELLPVIREYPRLSTVALDAYVGPVVGDYFARLGEQAGRRGADVERLFIMQSNGGLMRLNVAAAYPNETLLSGPAAGIAFAASLARRTACDNLLTFDMGGTSADLSIIRGGQAVVKNGGTIAGQEVGTSMIEIRTIGAGGGAIARRGEDGLLKVGPESAGASPGPACYARGGAAPTVTDANAVLGYIDARRLLGGELQGDNALAGRALARLGGEFGLDALQAAIGVRRVVNARMSAALRLALSEKGCDPRSFSMLAFGGCGPLHACEIAAELGIRRVVVPRFPGVSCAMGLLMTDVKHVYARSMPRRFALAQPQELEEGFRGLERRAREDAEREGFGGQAPQLERQVDARYARQGYQLTLPAPDRLTQTDIGRLRGRFDELHESIYGVCAPDEDAEIVTLRLVSIVRLPRASEAAIARKAGEPKPRDTRRAWFAAAAGGSGFLEAAVYTRDALVPGMRLHGPAIIEQLDATTVAGPASLVDVDDWGNLVIETGAPA